METADGRIVDHVLSISRAPSTSPADLVRQLQNQRRDIQESLQRGNDIMLVSTVPPWVSLALGSAYFFKSGTLADAEREYKAAIDADSRAGEALNNLAVVYFETQRFELASETIAAAEKAGFA